jgi:DNA gyrase subunit A
MQVDELRVMGRATQGVKVIRLKDDDEIGSVAKVEESVIQSLILDNPEIENTDNVVTDETSIAIDGETPTSTDETPNNPEEQSTDNDDQPIS